MWSFGGLLGKYWADHVRLTPVSAVFIFFSNASAACSFAGLLRLSEVVQLNQQLADYLVVGSVLRDRLSEINAGLECVVVHHAPIIRAPGLKPGRYLIIAEILSIFKYLSE